MDPPDVDILDTVVVTKTDEECKPSTQAPQFLDLFAEPQTQKQPDSLSPQQSSLNTRIEKSVEVSDWPPDPKRPSEIPLSHIVSGLPSAKPSTEETVETGETTSKLALGHGTPENEQSSPTQTVNVDQIAMELGSEHIPVELEFPPVQSEQSSQSTAENHIAASQSPDFSSLLVKPGRQVQQAEDDEFDFDLPAVQKSTTATSTEVKPIESILHTHTATYHITHQPNTPQGTATPDLSMVKQENIQSNSKEDVKIETTANIAEPKPMANNPESSVTMTTETRKAVDDWDSVQTITPGLQTESSQSAKPNVSASPLVNYTDLHQQACQSDLDQFKDQIHSSIHRTGFKAIKFALFGPPKLHKELQEERKLAFCLTHYSFDNKISLHQQTLQTLYKKLTGAKFDCARHGSHWEQIGFQGTDPCTDLRGCGMLGLLQLLYSVTTPEYLPITREIYNLSLHELQNFPFCIAGINMTRIVIQTLREDCLNKECNKRRGQPEPVMSVLNQMYMAAFYEFYTVWKQQHKTIADTGFVLKDIEQRMKKDPNVLLTRLDQRLKLQQGGVTGNSSTAVESPISFSKMEE